MTENEAVLLRRFAHSGAADVRRLHSPMKPSGLTSSVTDPKEARRRRHGRWTWLAIWLAVGLAASRSVATQTNLAPARPGAVAADLAPLLASHAETMKAFNSFAMQVEKTTLLWKTNTEGTRQTREIHERIGLAFDGQRARANIVRWGQVGGGPFQPRSEADRRPPEIVLWDGQYYYSQVPRGPRDSRACPARLSIRKALTPLDQMGYITTGILPHNYVPLDLRHAPCDHLHPPVTFDWAMRLARRALVRPARERVGASLCYVIEAEWEAIPHAALLDPVLRARSKMRPTPVTPRRGLFWLDPEHGYHVAQARVVATNYLHARDGEPVIATWKMTRFAQFDGVWLPTEQEYREDWKSPDESGCNLERYRCLGFRSNPDHAALRSFVPHDFCDGAEVTLLGDNQQTEATGTWRAGRVVDLGGKVRFDSSSK